MLAWCLWHPRGQGRSAAQTDAQRNSCRCANTHTLDMLAGGRSGDIARPLRTGASCAMHCLLLAVDVLCEWWWCGAEGADLLSQLQFGGKPLADDVAASMVVASSSKRGMFGAQAGEEGGEEEEEEEVGGCGVCLGPVLRVCVCGGGGWRRTSFPVPSKVRSLAMCLRSLLHAA
jgi:hypothetical protein